MQAPVTPRCTGPSFVDSGADDGAHLWADGEMTETISNDMSRAERRRFILRGLLRALLMTVVLVTLYFLGPVSWIYGIRVGVVLILAPLILLAVAVWQIRAILKSPHPGMRGIEALAIIAPLYLLLFAATYFAMARADPASFSADPLTRVDTLYFTVTIFSTVGFGDISPVSEAARLVVTIQMILNLIVLGAGVRLLTAAVQRVRRSKADGVKDAAP